MDVVHHNHCFVYCMYGVCACAKIKSDDIGRTADTRRKYGAIMDKIKPATAVVGYSEEEFKHRWEEYCKEAKSKVEPHRLPSGFVLILKESIADQLP